MPELPEVETVKRQLTKYLVGHMIQKVEVRYEKCFQGNKSSLVGGKVVKIRRFGKVQSIDLDNGYSIVVHIKLTGQLIYRGPNLSAKGRSSSGRKRTPELSKKVLDGINGKHTHVIFHLDGPPSRKASEGQGAKLYYNDVRKFGWLKVVKTSNVEELDFIKKLGPEPLAFARGKPKRLTLKKFREITGLTKRAIKTLLMDQTKISGIGNIYANDALWLARVHPQAPANNLSNEATKLLFHAIETVLKEGLKRGGASELAFVTPDGKEGSYQNNFLAYGREGEKCSRCKKAKFKKIKIAGRGTVYCPACQRR